ncbi:MAG TPA: 2-amino-4-hydroxy-6-hydroxymethyldihydropteridine diphosphokinase [Tepidisphaeraceae bacterium]|nr:2-amino-4-hydroxy-6-hydroxymethyldihydropteridine diphosphokinase [Tepidisphaeraceae bacterium]
MAIPTDAQIPVTAYVALGANLGDRAANLRRALELLRKSPRIEVISASSSIENPAVGGPTNSPAFLNGAAEINTTLAPRALLDRLLEIEKQLGRIRSEKWSPRTIDLDLLLYGSQIIDEPGLTVPHPLMHERRFVLEPLAELAPDIVHPVFNRTIADLLKSL